MSIDTLNNSQFMLLVLLISLVVSAATAVATLSVVYERIARSQSVVTQPTIIQQTVNRIIERDSVPVAIPEQEEEQQQVTTSDPAPVTISVIQDAFVRVYNGSQQVTVGMFVTAEGMLLVPSVLEWDQRYNLRKGDSILPFSVTAVTAPYSLLTPLESYTPSSFVPYGSSLPVALGQPAVLFGGFGNSAVVFSEIVSQKQYEGEERERIRTSASAEALPLPTAVFVHNALIGFILDRSGLVALRLPSLTPEEEVRTEEE